MLEVEGAIKRTMHSIAREALTAYPKTARTTWILQWPGQLVLNGSQVFWTREVTDAIQSGGSKGLSNYAHKWVISKRFSGSCNQWGTHMRITLLNIVTMIGCTAGSAVLMLCRCVC